MAKRLTDKQKEFLEHPYVGVATTLRPDGSPHSTVVWVDVDDGGISFNTAYGRAKPTNLQQDARASLLVLDPADPYRWVSVDGTVELTTEGADAQIDKLAKKYLGADEYPWRKPEEQRVTVRFRADRIQDTGIENEAH